MTREGLTLKAAFPLALPAVLKRCPQGAVASFQDVLLCHWNNPERVNVLVLTSCVRLLSPADAVR